MAKALDFSRNYLSMVEGGRKPGKGFVVSWRQFKKDHPELKVSRPAVADANFVREDVPAGTPREKLEAAIERKGGVPAVAQLIGRPAGILENIVRGTGRMTMATAKALVEVLDISLDELTGGSDSPWIIDESGVTATAGATPNVRMPFGHTGRTVPRLSMAQAGQYQISHSDEGYDHTGDLAVDVADRKAFAVEIDGDSMSPRINPGDLVIATPSHSPVVGKPVLVQTIHGEAFCKLLIRQKSDGSLLLGSWNPVVKDMEVPGHDVAWIYPIAHSIQKF